MTTYYNPVIRGCHPDPSICRAGEDFYVATSSFTYAPGVPVYHSRDLVHWRLVSHCLSGAGQLQLEETRNSRGIYAPTLRYHQGRFYMITTDVDGIGNFIVHAGSAAGPWSDPVPVAQAGIDPSLFWDDDGVCWYCGKGRLAGERGIIAFALNPLTGERLTKPCLISKGCGGKCAEGPHLYKKDGWYYLVTAEGGTQYSHRAVIQRSRKLLSGYEPCPHNPILSHGEQNWLGIQAVGHLDLIEDQHGNWWGVCLGIRMFDDILLHNLGRETFLVPVIWQDGWPRAGNAGCVGQVMAGPLPGGLPSETGKDDSLPPDEQWRFDYQKGQMPADCVYIRRYNEESYQPEDGRLLLWGSETVLDSVSGSPVCLLRPQEQFTITATACLNVPACGNGRFGITAYYSNYNHYDLAVIKSGNRSQLTLYKHIHDLGGVTETVGLAAELSQLWLRIRADQNGYYFEYRHQRSGWQELGRGVIAGLCTEAMMERSYTGTMIGLFAEGGKGVFEEDFVIDSKWQESWHLQVPG